MFKRYLSIIKKYQLISFTLIFSVICLALDILGTKYHWTRVVAHIGLAGFSVIISLVVIYKMIDTLRFGSWGIDVLAVAATISAVFLKEYYTAMIVIIMLIGGETLEAYAKRRATVELKSLLKTSPQNATIVRGRKFIEVLASQVHRGDKLLIKPGEIVPVDCEIVEGQTSVNESSLTGESLPVDKSIGDDLLSGSINLEGSITVRALKASQDSQYEQIIKLVKNAASTKAPFAKLADRFSLPFTIMSFMIAGGVWIWTGDSERFLKVLVVATPCPLLLGAPVGLISGMSRAARHGIIIKSSTVLEKLANLKTLAFDKTGTLTKGHPSVEKLESYDRKISSRRLIELAGSLAQRSNHVLSAAIIEYSKTKNIRLFNPRGIEETPGSGVFGLVGKDHVLVGKLEFMKSSSVEIPKQKFEADKTIEYIALNGRLVGCITFADAIRPESLEMINRIKKIGIKNLYMLTGDNKRVAGIVADSLGITHVRPDCLPVDKVDALEELSAGLRPVGFVGDGVNDAPVLAAADVGIALGARGSTAASESAGMVILQDDVRKVAQAIEIAKRTFSITQQTIIIGILLSLGLMAIFATGRFKAVYGAAIQEVVDVSVILNALRAHRG